MSIKAKIERLDHQERRQLAHAFDCGISQYVTISNTNEFVGVHIDPKKVKHLQIKETVGVWSYGCVKEAIS